jgi:hypothetical protein
MTKCLLYTVVSREAANCKMKVKGDAENTGPILATRCPEFHILKTEVPMNLSPEHLA